MSLHSVSIHAHEDCFPQQQEAALCLKEVLFQAYIFKGEQVLLPTWAVFTLETLTRVKSTDKELIALTILQGIHSSLAHGFVILAGLDCRTLIDTGRIKASVTFQGLSCKEEKHRLALRGLPYSVRVPSATSGEGIFPKFLYQEQGWNRQMYLYQWE